jgi:hypothetical protein
MLRPCVNDTPEKRCLLFRLVRLGSLQVKTLLRLVGFLLQGRAPGNEHAPAPPPHSNGRRHVARMSQEPAEWDGTGRNEPGCGGITTSGHSERLRGKGAILLEVSHRPARVRFQPPPTACNDYLKSGGAEVGGGLRRDPMDGA